MASQGRPLRSFSIMLVWCLRSRRYTARMEVIEMAERIIARTGHKVPVSGQYRPSGGDTEYTLAEGEKTPPNREGKRQAFILVDKTKHKS